MVKCIYLSAVTAGCVTLGLMAVVANIALGRPLFAGAVWVLAGMLAGVSGESTAASVERVLPRTGDAVGHVGMLFAVAAALWWGLSTFDRGDRPFGYWIASGILAGMLVTRLTFLGRSYLKGSQLPS